MAKTLGQYQVIKTLGEGSFGKVKLAKHSETNQMVALKVINRKLVSNLDMTARVDREIQYLKLLRHPHIIKLYQVITTSTEIIMVIEYAGGELFDYIVKRGKMPEDEARRFFQQIVCAVDYCHRHKIVHRDLKPENLLLDDNLNVKIADFGLSNIMTDGNFLKTSCGSPNYAAPEVISGKLYAGPEVDVWSCGVILYVMLCGRLPFDDEYIPTLFKKINGGIFTIPSYLSAGARHLLSRMLVVDPLQRATIAEIRESPWFAVELPDYLKLVNEVSDEPADSNIVDKVGRAMGYATDDIYAALNETQANEIKDAYKLVAENQKMKTNFLEEPKGMESFLASSPPTWTLENLRSPAKHFTSSPLIKGVSSPSSTIAVLSSSLPAYHRALMGHEFSASASNKKTRQYRWHFGIRSKSSPFEVMLELYKALDSLDAEWKSTKDDPFYVVCRKLENKVVVFMEVQLYLQNESSFLVDFKCAGYSKDETALVPDKELLAAPFPFLNVATALITELAVGS